MHRYALILAAALVPLTALADGSHVDVECNLKPGARDLMSARKDLVVPEGARVEDAVVVNANLLVKKGAKVKRAVAINGTVTLEPGAIVEEDAVAVGGTVRAPAGAAIKGDAVALGGNLDIKDKSVVAGERVNLTLKVGDTDFAQSIIEKLVEDCRVVTRDGASVR
jgi:hypothetical protein